MKAGLRTFVLLAWPSLAVLLLGLLPLLRTGQVDPRGWMWPALLLVPAAGLLKARRGAGAACWASAGMVGVVLCCAFLATLRVPEVGAVLWLALVVSLATVAGVAWGYRATPAKAGVQIDGRNGALTSRLSRSSAYAGARLWVGLGSILLALTACWFADRSRITASARPPELAIISRLPLFWREGAAGPAARVDAPIITVLRQRFAVQPLDSPVLLKPRVKRLLLAQPRALSGEELVALDQWVRRGGEALVLADPQLHWPMALPMGDRRRPPPVTLLAGLLGHWGVGLAPVEAGGGERRHFLADGRMLTLYAASSVDTVAPACRILARGLVARCRVGEGGATVVADADLIDDRLWLADPAAPLDPRQWTADTPQYVAQALGAALPGPTHWVRSGPALVQAVRWAVLIGIFWAALGAMLFRTADRPQFGPAAPRPDSIQRKKRG